MHKELKNTEVILFSNTEFEKLILEIKNFLDFNLTIYSESLNITENHIFLITCSFLRDAKEAPNFEKSKNTKVILFDKPEKLNFTYSQKLDMPISLSDLNSVIRNQSVKKKFSLNSSISIKDYILDKNEKKLIKNNQYISLTEREILLLEIFLQNKIPVTKKKILKQVWRYSDGADTHTVETHVYRLRKKIKTKFDDEEFITNSKDGYSI